MNRIKKTLSLMLCLVMCLALLPQEAKAEEIEIMEETEAYETEELISLVDPPETVETPEEVETAEDSAEEDGEDSELIPDAVRTPDAEVQATETVTVGDYTYTITDGNAVLTKYNGNAATVTVPTSMEYNGVKYKIRKVGDFAYADNTNIRSVTIPDGILSLGNCAFKNCTSLSSLTINGDIGDCHSYSSKNYNSSQNYSYYSTFYNAGANADSFTVTFGGEVTRIPAYLFATAASKADGVFCHVTNLVIGNKVTSVGVYAFYDCYDLKTVNMGSGLTTIGSYAFANDNGLTSINWGTNLGWIGEAAFSGCTRLKSLSFPAKLTSIYGNAFEGCIGLTTVNLPQSVSYLGNCAFKNCTSLSSLTINGDIGDCHSYSSKNYNGSQNYSYYSTFYNAGANADSFTVTFGGEVTRIPAYLFATGGNKAAADFCHITKLVVGNKVTEIAPYALYNCFDLSEVVFDFSRQTYINILSLETGNSSIWSAEYSFTYWDILFDANGGTGGPEWQTKKDGKSIKLSAIIPSRYGYQFLGWATSSTATKAQYQAGSTFNVNRDIVLYAVWEKEGAPVLTEAFNSATGVRVSWKPISTAVKYQLLRKNLTIGETQWKVVGETTACTLIDTTAKSSNRYTYTVRAVDSYGLTSPYDETGRTCTYIALANITNLRYGTKGVTLTWSKPAGAKNFRVMRRVDGTSTWTVLAVIEGTTYTDTTAKIGIKYWYTVRGVSMDNTVLINSYNGTGWSIKPVSAPVLTEAFNSATGVRVSWKAVSGAAKYRLLRKNLTTGTGWETIGTTTACTLIDTSAKSASRYTYTVECVDSNGRTCSTSDSTGRTCTYIAMSKITTIGSVTNGVKLVWSQPAGAKNFRVFRKTDGGTWVAIKDVMGTTYTDTTAKKGVKYWYTVRAITLAGDMYINSYNATGWSVTRK